MQMLLHVIKSAEGSVIRGEKCGGKGTMLAGFQMN